LGNETHKSSSLIGIERPQDKAITTSAQTSFCHLFVLTIGDMWQHWPHRDEDRDVNLFQTRNAQQSFLG
jgi:hypothetical protein